MYQDIPVLDVHGHVSVPQAANSLLVFMMGSNTPAESPIGRPPAGPFAVPEEDFRAAAQRHVTYMDERTVDVQVIGPGRSSRWARWRTISSPRGRGT